MTFDARIGKSWSLVFNLLLDADKVGSSQTQTNVLANTQITLLVNPGMYTYRYAKKTCLAITTQRRAMLIKLPAIIMHSDPFQLWTIIQYWLFSVHGLDTGPLAPFVAYSKSIAYTIPKDNVMKYKYGYTMLMQGLHGCVDINILPKLGPSFGRTRGN